MDAVRNPYAPGAGTRPPELAGRDEILERMRIAIERFRIGRPAKSIIMVGLRGVGKTVLLNQMQRNAEAACIHTVYIEASEYRSLPAILAPQLRVALIRLRRIEVAKDAAITGLRALAGFASTLRVKFGDIQVGVDYEPEAGLADNGDLEDSLAALLVQLGTVAKAAGTALVLFLDEMQYIADEQLASLITALHRTSLLTLPIILIGAGLPQLRGGARSAKSYAERLFDYPMVGSLEPPEARLALVKPAQGEGVTIDPEAADEILRVTHGYPYFLQEWGSSAWSVARNDRIKLSDIQSASSHAIASLDESFFRVRFDRMNMAEKIYLRAMASLGEGPHRSIEIATSLGRTSQSLGPIRSSLIGKGMIWSPKRGETAFTVPMFDQYMRRIMPGLDWKLAPRN